MPGGPGEDRVHRGIVPGGAELLRLLRRRAQPDGDQRHAPQHVAALHEPVQDVLDRRERFQRVPAEQVNLRSHDGVEDGEVQVELIPVDRLEEGAAGVDVAAPRNEPRPDDREIGRAASGLIQGDAGCRDAIRLIPATEPRQRVADQGRQLHAVPPLQAAGLDAGGGRCRDLERFVDVIGGQEVDAEVVAGDDPHLGGLRAGKLMRFTEVVETRFVVAERDQIGSEDRPGAALFDNGAGACCAVDRRLADRLRLRPATEAHQGSAEAAQHGGPLLRRGLLGHELDGQPVLGERSLGVAGGPGQERQARMEQSLRARVGACVGVAKRLEDQLPRAIRRSGEVGVGGRAAADVDPIRDRGTRVLWQSTFQGDRPFQLPMRIAEGVDVLGGRGRGDCRVIGLDGLVGSRPVPCELRGRRGRTLVRELRVRLQLARESCVQPPALTRREAVLDDLAKQLVAEGIPTVRQRAQDAGSRRAPERGRDLAGRLLDERAEQPLVDRAARNRQRPDDRERRVIESRHARQEDVEEGRRSVAARLLRRSEQLLGEQRVALGAAPDRHHGLAWDGAVLKRHQLPLDIVARQPAEVEPHGARRPTELGQPGQHRMARRQVVRPAGDDRDEPLRRHVADEERDQVVGGRIDPLDVLDDGQHRLIRPKAREEAEDPLEQPGPIDGCLFAGGRWRGVPFVPRGCRSTTPETRDLRHQRPEVRLRRAEQLQGTVARHGPNEGPQGLDERQVWQPFTLEVEAAAVQDRRAGGARPVDRLPDEAGLPDPGLAADDDDLWPTAGRPRQGVLDPAELDVPADRDRTRSGRHDRMVRPGSPADVAIGDGFEVV